jgi:hypothetical protein
LLPLTASKMLAERNSTCAQWTHVGPSPPSLAPSARRALWWTRRSRSRDKVVIRVHHRHNIHHCTIADEVSLPSLYACRQRKITASSSSSSGCRQSLTSESKALSCFLGWESLGSASNWIGFPSLLPSSSLPCHHHQAVTSIGLIDSFITSRICKGPERGRCARCGWSSSSSSATIADFFLIRGINTKPDQFQDDDDSGSPWPPCPSISLAGFFLSPRCILGLAIWTTQALMNWLCAQAQVW